MRKYYDIDMPGGGGEEAELAKSTLTPTVAPIIPGAPAGITAMAPTAVSALPINKAVLRPNTIPLPNYSDPSSRMGYLKQWTSKYGNLEGRGDTVLKVNDVPRGGSGSAKEIATKAGGRYGIDPALLYSSAMEEGMSGLFKDKQTGIDTNHRKPTDKGYQDFYGDKDFPINGSYSFGLNTFADRYPDLVKRGYLDKDFSKNFRGGSMSQEFNPNDFKSADAALQAKAAMMKYHYDDIDSYAARRGIKLSPKARDFFALAAYNGGEGTGHQMLNDYYNNGHLEGDKFLEARPTTGKGLKADSYKMVYDNVRRRLKMREGLKNEQLFE